jgi:CubicO group peptidase (beta-lactamase class C family)
VRGRPKSGDMQTMFRGALRTELRSNPGSPYAYSNVGYLTLGLIVEQVSGRPYEEECRRIVLERLGAHGSIDPELRHRAPNGGWVISAVDYVKFMQVWNPQAGVIGPTSRRWLDARIAHSQAGNPVYSLGMRVERTPTGVRYSHGGSVAHEDRGGSYALKFGDGLTVVALFTGRPTSGGPAALRNGLTRTFASH